MPLEIVVSLVALRKNCTNLEQVTRQFDGLVIASYMASSITKLNRGYARHVIHRYKKYSSVVWGLACIGVD
jgi:hypothetical protein